MDNLYLSTHETIQHINFFLKRTKSQKNTEKYNSQEVERFLIESWELQDKLYPYRYQFGKEWKINFQFIYYSTK